METEDSSGGWSDSGADEDPAGCEHDTRAHPFRIDARARYRTLELAGRGGMGEVSVARDLRLGRDVALKRIAGDRDAVRPARRFAREAWVTARLEHPSIVPIYDAGEGDDGRLYYTMRLIHGRSLREAMLEPRDATATRALLRHFLAACEAVAYAHSHGITHLDLKPANIMVGAFGETQVVDWGLAGFTSEVTARAFAAELPDLGDASAEPLGTPAYRSPEQARGAPADARHDVWALGLILQELIAAEASPPARDAGGRTSEAPRARSRLAGVPRELSAIVEKATARDPDARYRDAGDLARDLARYLDGRRVEAHVYSTLELARRLARRLRVPLAAAAGAMIAAAIALAFTFRTIAAERARALEAESAAVAALERNRLTSSGALARQAVFDLRDGALPEAELFAAHALLLGESADARGVLAAAGAGARPSAAESVALPGCDRVVPGTAELALCHGDRTIELWSLAPARLRWRRAIDARLVMLAPGARVLAVRGASELVVLDAASGEIAQRHSIAISTGRIDILVPSIGGEHVVATERRRLSVVSLASARTVFEDRVCGEVVIGAVVPSPGGFLAVCRDGRVAKLEVDAERVRISTLLEAPSLAELSVLYAALASDGRTLAAGGTTGAVVMLDLETGRASPALQILEVPFAGMGFLPASGLLVAAGERGGARVWSADARAELLRLPDATTAAFTLESSNVLTGGLSASRFTLPKQMAPRALVLPAGLAAIAVSPDGSLLAAGRSDGRVTVIMRASGRVAVELAAGADVVKALAFSPDGGRLAVSTATVRRALRVFDTATWAELPIEGGRGAVRRLMYGASGELIALHYQAPPITVWSKDGARRVIDGPELFDAAATHDRRELFLIAVDGGIYRLSGTTLSFAGKDESATTIAGFARRGWIATGGTTGVTVHEPGGSVRWIASPKSRLTDLAVSPDERYLLGARIDGTIAVWSAADDRLVATLRGHEKRVALLSFAPDGRLLSAGWDGRVLAWDLAAIDRPAASLAAGAKRTWAVDLERVLEPRAR